MKTFCNRNLKYGMIAKVDHSLAILFAATLAFLPIAGHAADEQSSNVFKVLEIERNHIGAYALFSGGTRHGLQLKTEMCVLKSGGGETAEHLFCAPVVNLRTQVGAFYIPVEFETDVSMGSLVVFKNPPSAEESVDPASVSAPWFTGGQKFDAGYMIQLSPAISANAISFAALPRESASDLFQTRDALNLSPLGARFSWGFAFLKPDTYLGAGLSYAATNSVTYSNDYDLTDVNSYVESSTSVSHLGLSIWYGVDRNLNDTIGWRATAGLGMRRASVAAKSQLKGPQATNIAEAKIIATAPVVEASTGMRYTYSSVEFTSDFHIAVASGVSSTITGTFNSTQEIDPAAVKASVLKAVNPAKGLEMAIVLGARLPI